MTTYLHFDLGSNREAYEQVLDEIRRHSSKPSELVLSDQTLSAPVHMKSELETLVSSVCRLVDEMDYEPCTIELRHVLTQISADGTVTESRATAADAIWQGADTKYVATEPGLIDMQHVVTIPKRATPPPEPRDGWSFTDHPDAWRFHFRKPPKINVVLQREREKIASLYKDVEGVAITSRLEQILARWTSPVEPAENNQYRVSTRRLVGASPRRALDLRAIYAEIKNNHDHSFLNEDELHARIIGKLEACRDIALKQGLTPLILGLGLIPVLDENGVLKFGNPFCARGVSYGRTKDEADGLINAFGELIYYLMKFGRSPLLSPPQRYGYVAVWREVLEPPPAGRAKASQPERNFMATMERVHEIAASQQFKPLDEVARNLLLQRFGAKFDLHGLGILGIPIGTEPDAKGSSIGGCLFALVYAPNLSVKQLDDLAVYEILFLKSHPLNATQSAHAAVVPRDAKEELIQWAKDHDVIRRTVIALQKEKAGTRMNLMRTLHTGTYVLMQAYSLHAFEKEIENRTDIGSLMQAIWTGMTTKDPSYLFKARKLAGLPSLRAPKRKKGTKAAKA
jgi:hypothetical protein